MVWATSKRDKTDDEGILCCQYFVLECLALTWSSNWLCKRTCGSSYQSLQKYLQILIEANPGTIAHLDMEYKEGVGHCFKYMFLAMGSSVKGFEYMPKVMIINGTHLRGKYACCLWTASDQDGNYQIFPLVYAVVDGENDKSWEWVFNKLSSFVPNENGVVFFSDRHASIYQGFSTVFR